MLIQIPKVAKKSRAHKTYEAWQMVQSHSESMLEKWQVWTLLLLLLIVLVLVFIVTDCPFNVCIHYTKEKTLDSLTTHSDTTTGYIMQW